MSDLPLRPLAGSPLSACLIAALLFVGCASLSAQERHKPEPSGYVGDPKLDPNVIPRPPREAMATIQMMPGFSLELVAHEPMVKEPSTVAWDGNGRMYVAELRTYMQDIDGSGKFERTSRIVRLEDTDGDGLMDKQSVFAEGLLLPRMVMTMHEGIIIRETNTLDLWWLKDLDGDGVSDWRKKVFEGGPRGGNLEHQPSSLMWAMDNRCYVTYTNRRYRWMGDHFATEALGGGDGQWGLTQDDEGQLFFSRAGGETPCASFQQNLQYGKLAMPGQFAPGYAECWPIDEIPDVQGGPRRIREDNTLNHFTSGCGQLIFRGDRLPRSLYGDYFLAEPVGRLIRRSKVTLRDGVRVLSNAYDKTEWIATKDANFRPVNLYTGPDGTMYMVDMYRGIIQEGNWVRKGSYLRGVVQKYGLDKNIGRGRIYRVRHRDFEPGPRPNMLEQSSAQLVPHLGHPNGWWRDEAQKLIVLRADRSVTPQLEDTVQNGSGIARLHALWTLDGLGTLKKSVLLKSITDSDPIVQKAAIRISERYLGAGRPKDASKKGSVSDSQILAAVRQAAEDDDPSVVRQAVLTAAYRKIPGHESLLRKAAARHPSDVGLRHTVSNFFERQRKAAARAAQLAKERARNREIAASIERGAAHYQMLCFACHGSDGKGMPIPGVQASTGVASTLAPTLVGSPRVLGRAERTVRIALHGMQGPIDGKTYLGVMAPLASNSDAWVADVLTYVRRSWGNKAAAISTAEVTRIRAAAGARERPWTVEELRQFDPILNDPKRWQLSSSVNSKQTHRATDTNRRSRWTSDGTQGVGMWFKVELPYATSVASVQAVAHRAKQAPLGCQLELSVDGVHWTRVAADGKLRDKTWVFRFKAQQARHLRISLTAAQEGENWTIADLKIGG